MKRKLLWALAVLVVLGFAGAFFAAPFLTAQSLVRAARAGDAVGIERHVDFPAFRQSLKDELSARLLAEFGGEPRGGDDLGGILAAADGVDVAVVGDGVVKPDPLDLSAHPAHPRALAQHQRVAVIAVGAQHVRQDKPNAHASRRSNHGNPPA